MKKLKINGVEHTVEVGSISDPAKYGHYNVYVVENGLRVSCHTIPLSGSFFTSGNLYQWVN